MNMGKRTKSNRERAQGGFTLIEILAAMAVFMIGVMGMVALQGVSIHAAAKGRQQTAAVNIARYLVAELKSEFAAWGRAPGPTFPSSSFPAQFALLSAAASNNALGGDWIVFGDPNSEADLRVDELFGHSQLSDGSAARFCVAYRVDTMEHFPEGTPLDSYSVWQIRVRVSWTKEGHFQAGNIDWDDCSIDNVNARILIHGSDDVVELVSTATREFAK